MTILVTGCAGFIGWKVCEELIAKDFCVIGVDNLNDHYDPKLKEWRLNTLLKSSKFKFFKVDISDYKALREIFESDNITSIINLAARAGVRTSIKNPWVYLSANTLGTLNLLELAKEFSVKKFILSSTSSLYGLERIPFFEEQKTDFPLSPYAATKKGAEVLCYTYHYLYKIDVTVFRYFTVYGPCGRPDMSIFRFIRWIDEGKPVQVFGDGKQMRDFTYIDDIAKGTIKGLKEVGYEIINLGNHRSVELNYVIELIEKNLGKKAKIERLPAHPADVPKTYADISKAKKILFWEPSVGIEEGIERTIAWYRDNPWVKKVELP